jgi:hypothetical protein
MRQQTRHFGRVARHRSFLEFPPGPGLFRQTFDFPTQRADCFLETAQNFRAVFRLLLRGNYRHRFTSRWLSPTEQAQKNDHRVTPGPFAHVF